MGPVTSVSDVAEWKTISIGTFPDTFALLTALSAIGCGVGNSAAEALARPAFTVSGTATSTCRSFPLHRVGAGDSAVER